MVGDPHSRLRRTAALLGSLALVAGGAVGHGLGGVGVHGGQSASGVSYTPSVSPRRRASTS